MNFDSLGAPSPDAQRAVRALRRANRRRIRFTRNPPTVPARIGHFDRFDRVAPTRRVFTPEGVTRGLARRTAGL